MAGTGDDRHSEETGRLLAASLHELLLEHQPQVCLRSGGIASAEALVRWKRNGGETLEAAAFVSQARASGVLPVIDDWVATKADSAAVRFREADPRFRIWVNVSPDDLGDGRLWRRITTCVRSPEHFGIEITEDAVMRDPDAAVRTLHQVRELGMCVALDDFGTGHSSLAQLKRLPIDVVKIDRTFTAGLPWDKSDRYLIEAVLHLAMRFKLEVVAEGIERPDQADWLRSAGCTFGQGYLFGRPMPAEQLEAAIRLQDGTPARRATTRQSSSGR